MGAHQLEFLHFRHHLRHHRPVRLPLSHPRDLRLFRRRARLGLVLSCQCRHLWICCSYLPHEWPR